ncbi:MAG: hypothetical protein RLZZ511_2936, partial [Cyanobacteriota bacterium]
GTDLGDAVRAAVMIETGYCQIVGIHSDDGVSIDGEAWTAATVAIGHGQRVVAADAANGTESADATADEGTWTALNESVLPVDPLEFRDRKPYADRVREMQDKTKLTDAVQTGIGKLEGEAVALAVMDFRFMGGSMGSVVGEKITRMIELATEQKIPVLIICASGGARMQEGMLSLMQMAKISGALERHREQRLLYMPILTNPTAGGVTASFAMLGDLILAEPKATIAFAGRRVVEQTIRAKLPDDFQTAEYLVAHGFVDLIVPRPQMKKTLGQLLRLHQPQPSALVTARSM